MQTSLERPAETGARHLELDDPGSKLPLVRARQRRRRLAYSSLAATLAVATAGAGIWAWQDRERIVAMASADEPAPQRLPIPVLPPMDLLRPLSTEEAQEANAERPIDSPATVPASAFRFAGDAITRLRAVDCLTQAIYYEAASEGIDGGRAVAQVVLNRVRHPAYPSSVCGVVYQGSERATGCQFTFTCDGSLARRPLGYLWSRSRMLAQEALAGRVFGPVGFATHYHADYVLPYWADSLNKIAVIGRHIFYGFRGGGGARSAFRQPYAAVEPEAEVSALPELATTDATPSVLEDPVGGQEAKAEIKVEADRVEALAPDAPSADAAREQLVADVARGQLIHGDSPPPARKRSAAEAANTCERGQVGRVDALQAQQLRVGSRADC